MSYDHLRPLSFGETLDGAFSIYRRNFSTFYLIALIPMLPALLVNLIAALFFPAARAGLGGVSMLDVLLMPYTVLATLLVWGAITLRTASAVRGEQLDWQQSLRRALPRLPALLGATIVVFTLVVVGSILLLIPAVFAVIVCFAIYPAVVLEGEGPLSAIGRSYRLSKGAWGRIFGILFVLLLIVSAPSMGLGMLTAGFAVGAASGAASGAGAALGAFMVLGTLLNALVQPLMSIATVVLYYDRRVRTEGLDIVPEPEQVATAI